MIKTRFKPQDRYGAKADFERDMPYPVAVGDTVEMEATGNSWTVKSVAWSLPEANDWTNPTTLIVRLV